MRKWRPLSRPGSQSWWVRTQTPGARGKKEAQESVALRPCPAAALYLCLQEERGPCICHSLGAHTLRPVHPEAWVLLARGLIFFLSIAWIFLSWNEFVSSEAPVPRALLPKCSCPQLPPSRPHRTVAAEVRKQVSRERSGSPHSSRRCSSSLGVSVWERPPPRRCCGEAEAGRDPAVTGKGVPVLAQHCPHSCPQ